MPSDGLIDRLVAGLTPVRRRSVALDALVLAGLCAVELAVFLGLGFMRPDMDAAMASSSFWWKLTSMGLIAAVGLAVAVFALDPVKSPRLGLRWIIALAGTCVAVGWLIDASSPGWPALVARVDWRSGLQCVYKMVVLAIPALVALGLMMRRGAPTDTGGTAMAAGIAAAAWGAFVFVFACPYDDPLYIVIWYAVACSTVTVIARLVLPRLTRW